MKYSRLALALVTALAGISLTGCPSPGEGVPLECDTEPVVMTTDAGVDFVRTPDERFANLPDFPYEAKYVEIDGLRQAYVDEGPTDGEPVLLLHGQPSWSYLYRKMIPVLVESGHRVIAMDHLGMGRSDKPIDIEDYSYLGHIDRLERFIMALGLEDITLFCQDWGSLIGLNVAGTNPDWFARIVVGNGALPVFDEAPFPPVPFPDRVSNRLPSPFGLQPDQQMPISDAGRGDPLEVDPFFYYWMNYAMKSASFRPSEVLESITWFPLSPEDEAAYDAPFPCRAYLAGPRVFPSLIRDVAGNTEEAYAGLLAYEKPFLTIWGNNDPGNLGAPEVQFELIDSIPGAAGQPHVRLFEASHFLQDDQGALIGELMNNFIAKNPL